jgi:hypothetical protein
MFGVVHVHVFLDKKNCLAACKPNTQRVPGPVIPSSIMPASSQALTLQRAVSTGTYASKRLLASFKKAAVSRDEAPHFPDVSPGAA